MKQIRIKSTSVVQGVKNVTYQVYEIRDQKEVILAEKVKKFSSKCDAEFINKHLARILKTGAYSDSPTPTSGLLDPKRTRIASLSVE